MVGAFRSLILVGAFAALAIVPTSASEAPLLRATLESPPLEVADAGTAHCRGIAPLQPRCSTSFTASSQITTSVNGLFTGELVCRFQGPYGSWLQYRLEVVAGLLVSASPSGTGLYAGAITLGCEAKGLFGAGGSLAGAGDYDVQVDYV